MTVGSGYRMPAAGLWIFHIAIRAPPKAGLDANLWLCTYETVLL